MEMLTLFLYFKAKLAKCFLIKNDINQIKKDLQNFKNLAGQFGIVIILKIM